MRWRTALWHRRYPCSSTTHRHRDRTIRSATDADWPAISLLQATSFGAFGHAGDVGRVADDDAGRRLGDRVRRRRRRRHGALPGSADDGARRRGAARRRHHHGGRRTDPPPARRASQRCTPNCTTASPTARYPIAGLTASEGGIYGRFGYGPATIEQELTVDRAVARFRDDAPDPGGVRMVKAADHRDAFAAIYERWRLHTPGGLVRPQRAVGRAAGRPRKGPARRNRAWFAFLHPTATRCTACSATTR